MVKLKNEFYRAGYNHKILWRDEDYAVTELTDAEIGKVVCLEVFKIRIRKSGPPQSKSEYPRESIPGDEAWGVDGYTVYTMEQAHEKINYMRNRKKQNQKQNGSKKTNS